MPSTVTPEQLNAIIILERVCSILSLIGCALILITFAFSRRFRKPINRLVFYASVGNILTNTATLIGRSGISDPNGVVCQGQAFLIQVFMCADAYWTLAMACNVYLTFFHKYDAEKLRTMEKYYFTICYAVPMVAGIVFLFLKKEGKVRVYGDATLWCWIHPDWDALRIAAFYGPVWVVIFITMVIYILAGKEIYKRHKELQQFQRTSPILLAGQRENFAPTKTTEVHVTSEAIRSTELPINVAPLGDGDHDRVQPQADSARRAYSVSVSTQQRQTPRLPASPTFSNTSYLENKEAHYLPDPQSSTVHLARRHEANTAAWSYMKVAMLFFTAMLVTWIPSSANRVYSVIHNSDVSPALLFASSFVLPLQGVWNSLIYFTTSWSAVVAMFAGWGLYRRRTAADRHAVGTSSRPLTSGGAKGRTPGARRLDRPGRGSKYNSTSSTVELESRPGTRDSDSEPTPTPSSPSAFT